ncbi:TetR/AcrR family transcriptional regulator C-terminal domain-containing protein, partial [Klebsiella pneumoniae subsp. pneumoniae]|nr:TetR/AcrR family transcriptional regulator C-terminal domain-containing protein [Klebsiella pneumoniae subsp. pneumoniae]
FSAAGPGRAQQMLEAIIAEAIEAGTLRACDPQEAADELAGLWLGMTSLAIKLGARPPLSDDEIKQRVERALDVFLRAYSLTPG